jgi:hypothetical protein
MSFIITFTRVLPTSTHLSLRLIGRHFFKFVLHLTVHSQREEALKLDYNYPTVEVTKVILCVIKHHEIKTYWGVVV